jgi:hypothetical protein
MSESNKTTTQQSSGVATRALHQDEVIGSLGETRPKGMAISALMADDGSTGSTGGTGGTGTDGGKGPHTPQPDGGKGPH